MRLALAAVVLVLAIAGLGYARGRGEQGATFITAPVERGSITVQVKATGTIEAVLTVDVGSQLSGRIADVFVTFNDPVKAGQPLARLDQDIVLARVKEAGAALKVAAATALVQKAALERAAAAVANARTARQLAEAQAAAARATQDEVEREYRRRLELAGSGSITERDLTQARAQRDAGAAALRAAGDQVTMRDEAIAIAEAEQRMAEADIQNAEAIIEQRQASLDQARLDLDHTVLRAPIDGTIIKRDVNPGQTVAVSLEARTLFRIANDLREMQVHGQIDEADVGGLKPGQAVLFTVDAFPDRTFAGRVLQVRKSPEVVQNVVTYTAIVSAPNPDLLLLPGMTAALRIVTSDTGETLKIPNQALRFRPEGAGPAPGRPRGDEAAAAARTEATVWAVGRDGAPVPFAVKLGASDDQGTQMTEGSLVRNQPVIVGVARAPDRSGLFGLRLGF